MMGMTLVVNAQNEQVMNNGEQPTQKVVFNDLGNQLVASNWELLSNKTSDKLWGNDMATAHVGAEPQETLLAYRPIRGLYISGFGTYRTYPENNVPGIGGAVHFEPWCLTMGVEYSIGFGSKDAPNSEKKGRTSMDAEFNAFAGVKVASFNKHHTDLYLIGEYIHLTNKDFQSIGVTSTAVEDVEVEGGIERTTTTTFEGERYDNKPYVDGFGGGFLLRHHFTFSPLSIFVKGTAGMVNSWNRKVTASGKESEHAFYGTVSVGISYNLLPARYNVKAMNKLGLSKADVRKIARSSKNAMKTLNVLANY